MSILSQQIRSPNINICVYSDLTTGLLSSNPARYQGGLVNTAPSSHFYPHDAVIAYFYCPNTVIAWKITVEFNPRTIFFHPLTKMTYHQHCPQSLLLLLATICIAELQSCANNASKAGSPLNNACLHSADGSVSCLGPGCSFPRTPDKCCSSRHKPFTALHKTQPPPSQQQPASSQHADHGIMERRFQD